MRIKRVRNYRAVGISEMPHCGGPSWFFLGTFFIEIYKEFRG